MEDGTPTLEVGFTIDTGNSFGELAQLQSLMGSAEAQIVADAAKIESATGGMLSLGGATANVKAFGNAVSKESAFAARELGRIEKAGEALSRQMERQASSFGKSKEEIRAAKVETAALAAEQHGLTELASRLRAQEAALYAEEFAAARRSRLEAEAAAEAKVQAAARAEAAAESEAAAIRAAANAYNMFEAVAKKRSAEYKQKQADEANLARSAERLRASIDPAAAAQQRFNSEMAEARMLVSAGAISLDEYVAKLRMEREALDVNTGALDRHSSGSMKNRMAMQGASYQVQDFITQVSMGANPINAFAVQGAQLAGQFSMVEGKAGGVARFFMGPWGLALTAGMMLLSPFVAKLFEGNNALDDAVDKLKKDAAETGIAAQAKERFRFTQEAVTAAVRDSIDATTQAIEASRSAAERANDEARSNIAVAISVREKTKAKLEDAKRDAEIAQQMAGGSDAGLAIAARMQQRVTQIEEQLAAGSADLIALEARRQETRIGLAEEAAKRMTDPMERIKKLYDDQANAAKDAARAQIAAGGEVTSALTLQLAQIERNRQAAVKAEQDKQQAARRTATVTNQIGRNIDLAEARRIAQSVGGTVTNDARSFATQQRLYAKYMAYKSGKGPWAAVAAKPGESFHELGQAVDVAKSGGVTLKKLVDAYKAAGVRVVEALDEGSHYHIAWKKVGAAAKEQTAEQRAAAQAIAEQKRQYEAAVKATDTYIAAQVKSTRETGKSAKEIRLMEDALQRLAAPTEAQKLALDEAAAARELAFGQQAAKDFEANVMQPLRDELALYGLVGAERAAAALELEKQAFIAKNMDQGIEAATARWEQYYAVKKQLSDKDVAAERELAAIKRMNEEMTFAADRWDLVARNVENAARGMAEAFGSVGQAIGDVAAIYTNFEAARAHRDAEHVARLNAIKEAGNDQAAIERERAKFAIATSTAQVGLYGDMAAAAKGFFKEGTAGYKALATAEKAFRAIEFALSVRAIAQDAIETGAKVASSAVRAAKYAVEAVAKAIASLPFPANLAAGAATAAALAAIGLSIAGSFGGGRKSQEKPNEGTGTVFGDASAKSESIKKAIDALKEVDTLTNTYARQMASSLRSIESQIGGIAALVVRAGDLNASAGVTEGFKKNLIGSVLSKIPVIGGILGGLFGSKTTVTGSGLYAGSQSLGSILGGGFDASYYSDIQKKKKFFGLTTSTKNSTQFSPADGALETQFTLLLRSFNDAILAAAGPLGVATTDIQNRLNGFVINLGKIDLKGLTGEQIQEKLSAVFGAAADRMANAAFPGISQFQKVGEGAFETLVRVASTVEAVSGTLDLLGQSVHGLGLAAKMGLADQFESVSALTDAAQAYFENFYTKEEQTAARTAQMRSVFVSLGLVMPATLASFRQLVEAQDLTTAAGQETYATLLKLAPAFAELQASLAGAKSAADIASERAELERQLLQLRGDTAAIRALDLAKLDASNRALQEQIWSLQDAQEVARAADELRKAWVSVGDSIMDEVRRIRGLDSVGGGSFASLMGRFNATTAAARAGDMDAAKSLPQLSQALLTAAAQTATSRQELARVQAQTAASLEATYGVIGALSSAAAATSSAALATAASTSQAAVTPSNDNSAEDLREAINDLRDEVAEMRRDNNAGHAATAGNTGRLARKLEDVTASSGGDAIAIVGAAA